MGKIPSDKPKISSMFLKNVILITIIFISLIGFLWLRSEYLGFISESQEMRDKYLSSHKARIKSEVDKAASYIQHKKFQVEKRLSASIKDRVYEAHAIALNLVAQYQDKRTPAEMEKMVKDALSPIRFGHGRGYFFVFNLNGIEELLADRPEMEGKDVPAVRGIKGEIVVSDMIEIVNENTEGFYKYKWTKPNEKGVFLKIAFVKLFEPFQWGIGTGAYMDDAERDVQKEAIEYIEQIRYGKNGYVFAGQWDGVLLTGSAKGENISDLKDVNGVKIVQEFTRLAKKGGGYLEYVMPGNQDGESFLKLSYVVGIPEWKWGIGAGIDMDAVETAIMLKKQEVKQDIIRHAINIILTLIGLILFVSFVAVRMARKTNANLDLFSHFFKKSENESVTVNPEMMDFVELESLAYAANDMVAARNLAEEAVRESENKFKTLFEFAPDAYYLHDIKGNFIDGNRAAEALLGYKREEVIGKNFIDAGILPSNQIEKAAGILRKGVTRKKAGAEELTLRARDGSAITVEISSIPIRLKGQKVFLGIARDVTERKRLEENLRHAQKMESIGTLAGGVAHDLNNILSGLVSYPELLLMDLSEDSPMRKAILTIKKSGEKAATIVQDLLTLARRGVTTTRVADLNEIVMEFLSSPEYEKIIQHHPAVNVDTRLDASVFKLVGSPVHLSKTVMNLVSNAAEAMPDGGDIVISTQNTYLDQPVSGYARVEEGEYVLLTLSDTGIGIPKKDLKRIFEPFYTKKVMGRSGTGLGMAVVWGTIKDHEGYIDAKSIEGKGTTFRIYFPATRKEIEKEKAGLAFETLKGGGESILVVDDVEEQKEIASGMLKKLGYTVTSVASGEEAVEFMKHNTADLMILDMIMDPGIDGLETYKRILKSTPGQKAIIASGYSETDRVKKAQNLGTGEYLKKPYLLESIGCAVKAELNK